MVSVIIPVYNSQDTIISCLNSVINQTYKNKVEILIINDGSTDNSMELIKKFISEKNVSNVYVITKDNGGVSSARNRGIIEAKGSYIAFLDSDDEWLPQKLEKEMDVLLRDPSIDFIGCNRNNEKLGDFFNKKGSLFKITFKDLLIRMYPQTSTAVIKKSAIINVGMYDENQKYAEDGNLWLKLCAKYNCYMLNESLVITGGGKPNYGYEGLSSNLWEMTKGNLKNYNEMKVLGYINIFQYLFFVGFTFLKHIRRVLIVKFRE